MLVEAGGFFVFYRLVWERFQNRHVSLLLQT